MVILEWTETTVNDFKRKFTEDSIRRTVSRPRDSFFNKDFYDACVKWVEDNPEKIDLDKLAPGSVFEDTFRPFGGSIPSLRILTNDGWVSSNLDPTERFMEAYRAGLGGKDRYKPIVLVYKD